MPTIAWFMSDSTELKRELTHRQRLLMAAFVPELRSLARRRPDANRAGLAGRCALSPANRRMLESLRTVVIAGDPLRERLAERGKTQDGPQAPPVREPVSDELPADRSTAGRSL